MSFLELQEERFERFHAGDEDALIELLDYERPLLYDYMLRMTGQEERAHHALDEVWSAMQGLAKQYPDYVAFKLSLFATARNFNINGWNASTAGLIIPAIQELPRSDLKELDHAFKSLPGPEREVLILHFQNDFDLPTTAKIMGGAIEQVEKWLLLAEKKLALVVGSGRDVREELNILPRPQISHMGADGTIALSEVIADVRKSKPTLWERFELERILKIAGLLALIALGVGIYFWLSELPKPK